MIQRIQTLWLALALLLSVMAFFFPLANFVLPDQSIVYNLVVKSADINSDSFFQQSSPILLIALNVVFMLLCLVTIFTYKNRILQMKILAFAFLVLVAYTLVLFLYQTDAGLKQILNTWLKGREDLVASTFKSAKTIYGLGSYFPIAQIICLVFARNGIRKDEKLVRASDRLR
ncbi:MAG: DUF4293 domain-containing protein [Bacteroidota bacterium]|nr:DUF4293 domain-containing protein [Bacteroidota bacterium]